MPVDFFNISTFVEQTLNASTLYSVLGGICDGEGSGLTLIAEKANEMLSSKT